jgi:hypothetical protein
MTPGLPPTRPAGYNGAKDRIRHELLTYWRQGRKRLPPPPQVAMEIFRDLYLSIEPDGMAATADLIERSPPPGWTRDRAAEGRARSYPALLPKPTFCFSCSAEGRRPAAMVILTQKDAATFFVSNIIPTVKHQLGHGEYNAILEDFYDRVIRPYTGTTGLTASLTGGEVDLEHWMSHETAELLRRFSACANRGTGSSHPADRDRWNAFVMAAHLGRSKMDAADLRRWLLEVDGWPQEVADQLAVEYEYGRELLAFADGHRRSA